MEVQEVSTIEMKYRRPDLAKRGVSAKYLQERRDAVKRRASHRDLPGAAFVPVALYLELILEMPGKPRCLFYVLAEGAPDIGDAEPLINWQFRPENGSGALLVNIFLIAVQGVYY
jgi:hypothetical protein